MRICKNKATDIIRNKYKANPLMVPDSRVQPYETIVAGNKEFNFFGNISNVLSSNGLHFAIKTSQLADVEFKKTKDVNIKLGIKILDGFLKALKIPSALVGLSLKGAKTISFSFLDAERHYLELTAFGKELSDNNTMIDTGNVALTMLDDDKKLCLITDAFVSPKLEVIVDKASDNNFEVDIPVIEKYVADANLEVGVKKESKSSISFSGPTPLTYAFSCIQIGFNAVDGAIKFEDWISLKAYEHYDPNALRSGEELEELEMQSKILFDDDEANPELFSIM